MLEKRRIAYPSNLYTIRKEPTMQLKGTFTAMITPFQNDELNEEGLVQNIRRQISAGITGLVFLGTTGETATLTDEEQKKVIEIGVKEAKGKVLVLVGTGSNSTRQTIEKTKRAKELGADIALIVAPYYNKPSQEGIYRHFEAIVKSVKLPVLVYNIPGRTGVNIETPTLLRMAGLPYIMGVKDSSGNMSQAGDVVSTICKQYPQFTVLSGDDDATLPMVALGATGVVSVVSNLVPERIVGLVEAALKGDFLQARKIHHQNLALFKHAFIEVNPAPIKEAMNLCGMAAGPCRLPLCELRPENHEKMKRLLLEMGLATESLLTTSLVYTQTT